MKKLSGIFLLLSISFSLSAQTPVWQKEYVVAGSEYMSFAHRPLSSGYLHFVTLFTSAFQMDYRLIRTDSIGQLQWWKEFSTTGGAMKNNTLLELPGGGYFASLYSGNNSYELLRLTTTGSTVWSKRLTSAAAPYSIVAQSQYAVRTADNGYVLSGDVIDISSMRYAYHLVKTDSGGNVSWSNAYHWAGAKIYHRSLDRCVNDDLAIFGNWDDSINGNGKFPALIRVAPNGNQLWGKQYWDPNIIYECGEGKATPDNGFVMTGTAGSGAVFLVKLDSAGNVQWGKTYGNGVNYLYGRHVIRLTSGGYAISASNDSTTVLLVTDSTGQLLWAKEYSSLSHYPEVQETATGFSLLGLSLDQLHLLHVVTDISGNSGCNETNFALQQDTFSLVAFPISSPTPIPLTVQTISPEIAPPTMTVVDICSTVGQMEITDHSSLQIFPVPATTQLRVTMDEMMLQLALYNCTGQLIRQTQPGAAEYTLDVADLPGGVYLLELQTAGGMTTRKVMIGE